MASQQIEHLVKMADQIALNLGAGRDDAAAQRTAQHIMRFWTRAMRQQLIEFWRGGGRVTTAVASALAALEQADSNRSESV